MGSYTRISSRCILTLGSVNPLVFTNSRRTPMNSTHVLLTTVAKKVIQQQSSIHLSIFLQLITTESGSSRLSKAVLKPFSLPQTPIPGDSKASQGLMGYIIPPVCSGVCPRSPPSWTCLEYLHRKATGRHLNKIEWLLLKRRSSSYTQRKSKVNGK